MQLPNSGPFDDLPLGDAWCRGARNAAAALPMRSPTRDAAKRSTLRSRRASALRIGELVDLVDPAGHAVAVVEVRRSRGSVKWMSPDSTVMVAGGSTPSHAPVPEPTSRSSARNASNDLRNAGQSSRSSAAAHPSRRATRATRPHAPSQTRSFQLCRSCSAAGHEHRQRRGEQQVAARPARLARRPTPTRPSSTIARSPRSSTRPLRQSITTRRAVPRSRRVAEVVAAGHGRELLGLLGPLRGAAAPSSTVASAARACPPRAIVVGREVPEVLVDPVRHQPADDVLAPPRLACGCRAPSSPRCSSRRSCRGRRRSWRSARPRTSSARSRASTTRGTASVLLEVGHDAVVELVAVGRAPAPDPVAHAAATDRRRTPGRRRARAGRATRSAAASQHAQAVGAQRVDAAASSSCVGIERPRRFVRRGGAARADEHRSGASSPVGSEACGCVDGRQRRVGERPATLAVEAHLVGGRACRVRGRRRSRGRSGGPRRRRCALGGRAPRPCRRRPLRTRWSRWSGPRSAASDREESGSAQYRSPGVQDEVAGWIGQLCIAVTRPSAALAAVDLEDVAVDVAGVVRHEERVHRRDVVGLAHRAERHDHAEDRRDRRRRGASTAATIGVSIGPGRDAVGAHAGRRRGSRPANA